jgi:putative ABC transport system permease protein
MVRRMGWENPIGKKFQTQGSDTLPFHKVVGVVRGFHQRSLYDPIEALLFIPNFNNGRAFVKISGEIDEGITYAQQSWEATFPNLPFEYEFVDENFQEQYETDQQRGQLFLGFSILTIIIACLGLLGLASFTATQRAKEISIRKVLGTDVTGLVSLLVKDFIILVVIAAAPAFAAAYFFMADWLTIFEYHMQLGVGLFALVLVLTLVVTVLTTSYHAYRAAVANPIENLKYE